MTSPTARRIEHLLAVLGLLFFAELAKDRWLAHR